MIVSISQPPIHNQSLTPRQVRVQMIGISVLSFFGTGIVFTAIAYYFGFVG